MKVSCITVRKYIVELNNDDVIVMDFVSDEIEVTPPDLMCIVIQKMMNKIAADFLADSQNGT